MRTTHGTKKMTDAQMNTILMDENLTLSCIHKIRKQCIEQMDSVSEIVFDFSKVQQFDTSALSLMLVFIRQAKKQQLKSLRFAGVNSDMKKMLEMYGVSEFITPHFVTN